MGSSLGDRRQRHDRYYRRAKQQHFPARAVFKLEELDNRFALLKPGHYVLDLGCRPGSWLLYAAGKVGQRGHVVGVDRQALDLDLPPQAKVIVGDIFTLDPAVLLAALPGDARYHAVVSDMAPDTSGVKFTDQCRSVELFERALAIAAAVSRPGAVFVGKVFMGEGFDSVVAQVKAAYQRSKTVKPDASRKSSTEVYIVGLDKRASGGSAGDG